MLLAVVEVHEDALSKRRASDAARQAAHRAKTASRDQTLPVSEERDPPPHVGERTQVVTPSLPSLRSEELTEEPNGPSVNASKPAEPVKPATKPPKSNRGTRLSEDWEPSTEEFELARSEGLTDEEIHRAALEFRNYWCSRSRDAAKLSWRLTWHNRVLDLAERKRRDGARVASRPAFGGGGGRGVEDFASIVARRRTAAQN
jgi:hypothetical protein